MVRLFRIFGALSLATPRGPKCLEFSSMRPGKGLLQRYVPLSARDVLFLFHGGVPAFRFNSLASTMPRELSFWIDRNTLY